MSADEYPIAEGVPDEFRQTRPIRGIVVWPDGRSFHFDGGQWQEFATGMYESDPADEEIMWRVNRSRRCAYCHSPFDTTRRPQIDHIVAWAQGGSGRPTNLVRICEQCNGSKGKNPFVEWAEQQNPETRIRCLAIARHLETPGAARLQNSELVDLFYPESDLLVGNHRPRRNSNSKSQMEIQ